MSERVKPTSPPPSPRGYKRSWRNLLINKRYQLRFTLFMAGLAGVLIAALGYFVMVYADRTTTIGVNRVISEPCQAVPVIDIPAPPPARAADPDRAKVVIDESESSMVDAQGNPIDMSDIAPAPPPPPPAPPDFVAQAISHWACEFRHAGAVEGLYRGRTQILLVLIGSGLLLVLGLAIYGIKMTHKVAGPLYKVTLYLGKMREGRLDKVWNLRKGDQLVEFYEHFKSAHAGVVAMEQADLARLRAMLEVIDRDPDKWSAPELADRVAELRAVVARKEKSLE